MYVHFVQKVKIMTQFVKLTYQKIIVPLQSETLIT
jgi:hypothetical protein